MPVEDLGRLFRELGAQRAALLGQAAHQLGIDDVGGLDRFALAQHVADDLRPGLGVRPLAPRGDDLRVEFAELLVAERRVIGADQQIGMGAELLGLGLGVRDLAAQPLDFAGQPLARAAGLLLPHALLHAQVGVGDGVGDPRRQHRVP